MASLGLFALMNSSSASLNLRWHMHRRLIKLGVCRDIS